MFIIDKIRARHLIAWSDSCGGQNKNFFIIAFWQYVLSTGRFDVIEHKFPEVGHSYMDSDRDFALIEKAVKRHEKIYSAETYRTIIRTVKRKNPFVVENIAGGLIAAKNFINIMRLTKKMKTTENDKVLFRQIRWIKINRVGYFQFRYSFDNSEPWKVVDIRGRRFSVDSLSQINLYSANLRKTAKRSIDENKFADLKKQLPYIPRIYKSFYENLVTGKTDNDSDDELDEDEYEY